MSRTKKLLRQSGELEFNINKNANHRRKHGSQRHELLKDNLTELNRI